MGDGAEADLRTEAQEGLIRIHPQAFQDINDAFNWYAGESPRQAERFQLAVREALSRIEEFPKAWPPCRHGMRRYVLSGFPYIVLYRTDERGILIAAVGHGKRKPDWWLDRLKNSF
jgi:plasmid stabilization system protein ParE